ncbi:MAG: peptidoglycan DD-metalloendopeptidase family protein [Bacteroidales bacterium]|nr:peptidoglycan DD-metalloendopeptidase family protein [Bacteroidales bacterium]
MTNLRCSRPCCLVRRLFLCVALAAGLCWAAAAQDVSAQKNQIAKLEKEIAIIDRQLSENSDQSRNALANLNLIRKKIDNRKALIAENDKQIQLYENGIAASRKQIQKLQAEIDTLSAFYARLVKTAYKNRDARIWYMYILASEDLGQAFRRYNYFRNMSSMMNQQGVEIRKAQDKLAAEQEEMQRLLAETETVRAQRQKELTSLGEEEKQAQKIVNQLNRNRTEYQKELSAKQKQVDALNREIKRMLAAAMKPGSGSAIAEIDYKLADEFSANKGKLPWPAVGPVVDKFGQHYHPVFTKLKLPFNNGVGIALSPGTEIKSVFDGTVKQIVVMPGYNQCVLVQHGNYFTFYCKLKSTSVKAGDKVRTGQVIGVVDTINGETQLHFQIWQNQTPQNPELWLR